MKKVSLEFSVEEIVLIKECLYSEACRQQDMSRAARTNVAFRKPAMDKKEAIQKLMDRLSVYGYGM